MTNLLADLKMVVNRVNAVSVDELAETVIVAVTTLVNLRKWMALGYATLAPVPPE